MATMITRVNSRKSDNGYFREKFLNPVKGESGNPGYHL